MRGLYIIVEGQTEFEFVNACLAPYLQQFSIYDVRPILLQTSPGYKGGDMKFDRFKWNLDILLKKEKDVLITSIIDFYRLDKNFPGFGDGLKILDVQERISFLEDELKNRINSPRFLPYIQLHEFEGLLFSDKKGIEYIPDIPTESKKQLEKIFHDFPNPEMINEGEQTAPSKRLTNLIPKYQKTLHGPIIALEIGIPTIREKCPRFNKWISNIVNSFSS
jgi:hypothetical protein